MTLSCKTEISWESRTSLFSHTHTKVNKRPLCHLKCQSVLCHSPPFCHLCVCYSIVTANPVNGVKKQVRRPEGPFESLSTQLLSTLSFGCRGRGSLQSGSPSGRRRAWCPARCWLLPRRPSRLCRAQFSQPQADVSVAAVSKAALVTAKHKPCLRGFAQHVPG